MGQLPSNAPKPLPAEIQSNVELGFLGPFAARVGSGQHSERWMTPLWHNGESWWTVVVMSHMHKTLHFISSPLYKQQACHTLSPRTTRIKTDVGHPMSLNFGQELHTHIYYVIHIPKQNPNVARQRMSFWLMYHTERNRWFQVLQFMTK